MKAAFGNLFNLKVEEGVDILQFCGDLKLILIFFSSIYFKSNELSNLILNTKTWLTKSNSKHQVRLKTPSVVPIIIVHRKLWMLNIVWCPLNWISWCFLLRCYHFSNTYYGGEAKLLHQWSGQFNDINSISNHHHLFGFHFYRHAAHTCLICAPSLVS